MDRKKRFAEIEYSLSKSLKVSLPNVILADGDSLDLLRLIPSHSISLILTDPPYHSTKKDNIHGDTSFKEDDHYLDWMREYSEEWYRVLKPNGSLLCYCSSEMSGRLEVVFSKQFNILSNVVWTKPNDPGFDGWKQKMKKEALRQWYAHTERIIFAEPSFEGNIFHTYFGNVIREARLKAEMTMKEVTEITGDYGKVNHGGAVSNWEAGRNVPSPEQYQKLCNAFLKSNKVKSMPKYEDVIRPFKMDASKEFTDVWNFPSVRPYKGKHPAEKPLSMLEHAIEATTNPGDIVLDCFSGSGNTGLAAMNLDRRAVLFEIDQRWITQSKKVIESWSKNKNKAHGLKLIQNNQKPSPSQIRLFADAN